MDTPDPHATSLAHDDAPAPFAPVLGGVGAPPPPPLYRKGRDLAGLKAKLGMYLATPGATGYVPDFDAAARAAETWKPPTEDGGGSEI